MELRIEYVPIDSIKPYENNARKHADFDVDAIAASIKQFGFDDPIGVWHDTIVEGHGRLLAAQKLGMKSVPIIRLDHLTDEERRAYGLAHNKTAENSAWDFDLQALELADIADIDMTLFGFSIEEEEEEPEESENPYTSKVDAPQYEPRNENVTLGDCLDTTKYDELIDAIENADVSEAEKTFLRFAAARHLTFSYEDIADYYAGKASPTMQNLMEKSALVIIDYNDAIRNGYAVLRKTILDLMEDDGYGEE